MSQFQLLTCLDQINQKQQNGNSPNRMHPKLWPSNLQQTHFRSSSHHHNHQTSLSNLEEHNIVKEPSNSPEISINRKTSHSYNDTDDDKQQRVKLSVTVPQNQFNLNYHGHIANHPSPRTATPKSSNPYELILDQKRLHKIIKRINYPVKFCCVFFVFFSLFSNCTLLAY